MDTPNGFSPCGPDKDLWQRIRRRFAMKNLDGNLVDNQVQWYTTRPDYVDRMVSRSSRYLFYIVEALEKRQMPTELALLPFIESAFNPEAKSHAKAVGMWQFIPSTGKDFNLKQNIFRDERRDVLASTNAALDYLQRLYSQFGDWHLALAAYNWGEGSVARAIARNQRAGLPTDYLSLKMPAETRHYVPKLQAVKNLIAAPHIFSLKLPTIENHPYFVTATTRKDIDVDLAAQLARLPLDEFKALNPSFNRPIIIGATQPKILLPFKNAEIFHENLNTYRKPLASWTAIRVVGRERIDTLGKRLGVDPSILRTVNRIPKGMRLTPGSTLVVPRTTKMRADISQLIAENAQFGMEPDTKLRHKIYVKARKHDTVNTLAARYRVSAAHIRTWNRLTSNAVTPGKQVVLYLPNPPKRIAKKNRQTKIVQAADR
ncbi:MAG: transglycosylase SLT domain-containing protein [Ottowia sp.]|nr:transglycosylase SLT domain-containing protein [Ottowia sp.]